VIFRTRLLSVNDAPAYALAEVIAAFDLDAPNVIAPQATAATLKRQRRTLPEVIPETERNTTLLSLAAGLVQSGFDLAAVLKRLQRINAERCRPPLCATEVDTIAAQAIGYGSNGFRILTDALLDSKEWKALAPAAHDIILMAYRRYNGDPLGKIALTFDDFAGRPGFNDRTTFYRHRDAAIASGILVRLSEGRNTQTGRTPDLFAIAPKWLRDTSAKSGIPTLRMVGKPYSYIDRQLSSTSASDGADGSTETGQAA